MIFKIRSVIVSEDDLSDDFNVFLLDAWLARFPWARKDTHLGLPAALAEWQLVLAERRALVNVLQTVE